ncbi:MAG: hypothetical protein KA538_05820 [Azonexus sp.]|jgi:hypothetical protein|nr:hypothetical protein [Azonexus sp.]
MKIVASILCIAAYYTALSLLQPQIEQNILIAFTYIFIPIVLLPLIVHGVATHLRAKKGLEAIQAKLMAEGFCPSHQLPSVLIDSKSKRVCFHETSADGAVAHWSLNFTDVLGTSIVKDEDTVHKTSSSSVIGRAIAGGVILGGIGAIIGGITAKSSASTSIQKLVLEIVLNCPPHPVHRVQFIGPLDSVTEGSLSFNEAMKRLEFMQLVMELMMMNESIPQATNSVDLMDTVRMVKLRAERNVASA